MATKTTIHAIQDNTNSASGFSYVCDFYSVAVSAVSTAEGDLVTCRRCKTALAKALDGLTGSRFNNIVTAIEASKRQALVDADPDVADARKYVVAELEKIKRLLASATEEVERSIARIGVVGDESYGALDIVMADPARIPSFIGSNMNLSSLARYAADLDNEIRRAANGERGWRGQMADRSSN